MIDFHAHMFPEKVAGKSIPKLAGITKTGPFTNGMESGLRLSTEENGFTCSINLPVITAPSQFDSVHRFAMQFLEGDIISFGSIHPDTPNPREKLRWIKEQGFKGIKMHPDYQEVYFDDIRYKRIVDCASELDLIIFVHAGVDPVSPNDVHCTPKMCAEILDEIKPEKLILAHMGGNLMRADVDHYLSGREVFFDTGYVMDKIPTEEFLSMIRKHGADKVVFGTDSPWADPKYYKEYFNQLPLSKEEYELISEGNARKLLGI